VLPDEVIGKGRIWYQSAEKVGNYVRSGTLQGWRERIANLAEGNPFLLLALAFAFSGPLLERLGFDGLGLHFHGQSSEGKTTVLSAASSVWGHGKNYRRTWRATANGLEGIGVQYTDTLLVLDEIHHINPRDLADVAYFVIDGEGKTRANRYGEARPAAHWRTVVLSSGEQSIRARLAEGGIQAKIGQGVRIIDVPISGKHGLFDDLHGCKDGMEFADSIRSSSETHYGHAGPEFVKAIIGLEGSVLRTRYERILKEFGKLDAREARAAKVFALPSLAGALASNYGLVNWKPNDVLAASLSIFNSWREARVTNEIGSEDREILTRCATLLSVTEKAVLLSSTTHPQMLRSFVTGQDTGSMASILMICACFFFTEAV
jgi:putative DNA primase/helicase